MSHPFTPAFDAGFPQSIGEENAIERSAQDRETTEEEIPVDHEIVDGPAPAPITDPELFDLAITTGIRIADDGSVDDVDAIGAGAYDAAASFLLRRARHADGELTRLKAAMVLELQQITRIYEAQLTREAKRFSEAMNKVERLAELARESGILEKKQSRDVGHGSYGWKKVASRVEIVDLNAAIAWVKEHKPDLIVTETKTTEKLPVAALKPYVLGLIGARLAPPPGVVHHPDTVKYFAEISE